MPLDICNLVASLILLDVAYICQCIEVMLKLNWVFFIFSFTLYIDKVWLFKIRIELLFLHLLCRLDRSLRYIFLFIWNGFQFLAFPLSLWGLCIWVVMSKYFKRLARFIVLDGNSWGLKWSFNIILWWFMGRILHFSIFKWASEIFNLLQLLPVLIFLQAHL